MKVKDLWRFAEKFESGSDEDCWEWLAGRDKDGYGTFRLGETHKRAHRVSYEYCVGPIPEGLQIDHLCRNRGCVNPNHLEPVTARENNLRGERPNRTHCPRGHEYAGDNLYIHSETHRYCRQCRRELKRGYRARDAWKKVNREIDKGLYNRSKTHCPRGHEYAGDNLYITPKGDRQCRQCKRESSLKHYYNRKGKGGS